MREWHCLSWLNSRPMAILCVKCWPLRPAGSWKPRWRRRRARPRVCVRLCGKFSETVTATGTGTRVRVASRWRSRSCTRAATKVPDTIHPSESLRSTLRTETSPPGDQCFFELTTIPPEFSSFKIVAPHKLRMTPIKGYATRRLDKNTYIHGGFRLISKLSPYHVYHQVLPTPQSLRAQKNRQLVTRSRLAVLRPQTQHPPAAPDREDRAGSPTRKRQGTAPL